MPFFYKDKITEMKYLIVRCFLSVVRCILFVACLAVTGRQVGQARAKPGIPGSICFEFILFQVFFVATFIGGCLGKDRHFGFYLSRVLFVSGSGLSPETSAWLSRTLVEGRVYFVLTSGRGCTGKARHSGLVV